MKYQRFNKVFLALIFLPVSLLFLTNFIVDPFKMNGFFDLTLNREGVAQSAHRHLYKIVNYKRDPAPNILLGDSRMDALDVDEIERITGKSFFNFAYGGGSALDAIETFWFASKQTKLESVYFGLNFNVYNGLNKSNLVREVKTLADNKHLYYLSPYITKISFYVLNDRFSGKNLASSKPGMSKDEFWEHQLGPVTKVFYERYEHPSNVYSELQKITDYCSKNNIELVFVIPPTHVDLQNKIKEFGLTEENKRFINDLKRLSKTINFDYQNKWTENKELFKDPYHASKDMTTMVTQDIFERPNKMTFGVVE